MTDKQGGGSFWRSARLPAILLFLYLAGLAGFLAWLVLVSGPVPPREPAPATALSQSPAAQAPEAAPPRPPPASEPADAPPAAEGPAAARPEPSPPAIAATPDQPKAASPPPIAAAPPPVAAPKPAQPEPAPPPPAPAEAPVDPEPPLPPQIASLPPPALRLPPASSGPPLAAAPDPGLVQQSARGPLPVVGRDGREAWRVYARPFDQDDKRPRIAVVISGLGISAAATEAAIQGLPGAIALAFSPYADQLDMWIGKARAAGHEVLLMAPMEPDNYPTFDPGPQALLTSLDPLQNVERLEWILGRATGHVGVMSYLGGRFTASRRHLTPVLRALRSRGLLYLDSRGGGTIAELASEAGVPFAASSFFVDSRAARPSIDARLEEAEQLAKENGHAIALGYAYPVTLERVAAWSRGVESRGFALAPVSAVAARTEPRPQ